VAPTSPTDGESIGPMMYTGTGGQTAFVIGAALAGGTTVVVTPSTALVKGERVSRIVASLAPGSVVTSPRGFVHYVATEYGIATLRGKSLRERIHELIAIAHPDFRGELRSEAKRLYNL
jgi:4-hydroxybutyrate CoA-transferase